MNKEKSIALIEELCNAKGISGFEDEVVDIAKNHAKEFGSMKTDSMLNLYLEYKKNTGNRARLQIDSHTDEIGFMVQSIESNGSIKFLTVGGWNESDIPAHQVYVRNKYGKYISGIVSSTPPHFKNDSDGRSSLSISSMSIDVGASSREEAIEKYGIRIGEPIVPRATFEYDEENDIMVAKAFDNRLGVAATIDTLKELENENINVDIVCTFSTQEEVGTRGAKLSARTAKADVCILFEGCPADDTLPRPSHLQQAAIKKGPMLRHMDRTMITNPRWQRFTLDIAEKYNIPVQEAVRSGGGTNASVIHVENEGIPCIVIGMPVRYAHTHYCIATYEDYLNSVKLAVAVIKELNSDIVSKF